jgi:signal transduction histidine kinase
MAWQLTFRALYLQSHRILVQYPPEHALTENATQGAASAGMTLTELVAAAAHDLNAPLFSILGLTQLLLDDRAPDEATRREFLTIIHRQATQLSRIVSDLRDLSALDAGAPIALDFEPVPVGDLVEDVVLRATPVAEQRHISLGMRIGANIPQVCTDRGRATQVLDNLLGNALKFTSKGGAVEVIAEPGSSSDFVRISVQDTGVGLPTDSIADVFEPFVRADPSKTDGSGLGLYISKQFVSLLRGRISLQSKLGEGSTFWIELPTVASPDGTPCRNTIATTPASDK